MTSCFLLVPLLWIAAQTAPPAGNPTNPQNPIPDASAPALPGTPLPSIPLTSGLEGTVMHAEVSVTGATPITIDVSAKGVSGGQAYVLGNEGRKGLSLVIGGWTRTPGAGAKAGVSFLYFLHRFEDGHYFLEAQVLNDAMKNPPGNVEVSWRIALEGKEIANDKRVLPDETGVTVFGGGARLSPRADLMTSYLDGLPAPQSVPGVAKDDVEKKDDPDPNPGTHAPGSPRNRYVAVEAAKFVFTQDVRYLDRLLDYVAAQARRPYHLAEDDGEPFYQSRYPEAYFVEGRPELQTYRETFGRILMTDADRGTSNVNGWDHEHMNVEELYAAYVFTGSRVARREMVLIAEELLSTRYVREELKDQHSARAFGWCARALLRAYQATGARRYLEGVKRMVRSIDANRVKDGPYPALVPQPPKADHLKDERWESPFMVAVATSTFALLHQVDPDDPQALEMLKFCGDLLVDRGYSPENGGFYYDYSVDSSKHGGDGHSTNGVATWICSPLVEVAAALPESERAKYLEPAKKLFEKNVADGIATPKGPDNYFYKWFLRAQKEFGK